MVYLLAGKNVPFGLLRKRVFSVSAEKLGCEPRPRKRKKLKIFGSLLAGKFWQWSCRWEIEPGTFVGYLMSSVFHEFWPLCLRQLGTLRSGRRDSSGLSIMCPSFEFAESIRRVLEIMCQFSRVPGTFPWLLFSHKCKHQHFVNETIKRTLFENHLRAGAHLLPKG